MTAAIDLDVCPQCDGTGSFWDDQTGQPDEPYGGRMIACYACKGEGMVDTSPCIVCGAPSYNHEEGCIAADHDYARCRIADCVPCGELINEEVQR